MSPGTRIGVTRAPRHACVTRRRNSSHIEARVRALGSHGMEGRVRGVRADCGDLEGMRSGDCRDSPERRQELLAPR